uniref:Pentatricopeptide repeat-containing protein n=1 Tax=Chenopodium quinoa TaxID=63459 RepID=A0A803N1K4_CHEQI
MISGYVRVKPQKSIGYFWAMLDDGIEANAFTLSAGIKACSEIRDVRLGRCFHGVVFRGGFELNDVIASALMDMYGKNGCLMYARNVFDKLSVPDPVCWSSIISALIKNDLYEEGLAYFYVMQTEYKVVPDEFTYGSILSACGNLERLKQGKEVHARVITAGLCGNVVAESSLVDMMMKDPDLYSLGTLIRACAGLAAVKQGREVHCQYIRKGMRGHIIESALVDLYAKCGCVDYAQRLFMQMPNRNLISWNTMISGFAQNGRGLEAIELFNKMVQEGVQPDYISFLSVIFACSHTGLVEQGQEYFFSMTEVYGIKPGTEHCNCMVDLLGRAGLINEAENLIEKAECKDSFSLWPALLGGCTTNKNSAAGANCAENDGTGT